MKKISVVIPCYNEEENIDAMCQAVTAELEEHLPAQAASAVAAHDLLAVQFAVPQIWTLDRLALPPDYLSARRQAGTAAGKVHLKERFHIDGKAGRTCHQDASRFFGFLYAFFPFIPSAATATQASTSRARQPRMPAMYDPDRS